MEVGRKGEKERRGEEMRKRERAYRVTRKR
jgi:hypothetical protein